MLPTGTTIELGLLNVTMAPVIWREFPKLAVAAPAST